MIKAEDILRATNGGLDIILDIYPQARECVDNPKKKFAIRNERTPSTNLRQYNHEKYGRIWQVTDFGGEGRGQNAIDVYMHDRGMDQHHFYEAIVQLAARYGVSDELKKEVNRPDKEERTATTDEPDGYREWEIDQEFSEDELRVLGPKVKAEDAIALGWHSVKWIMRTRDRKTTIKRSNDHYPIFARKCIIKEAVGDKPEECFWKIYEPYNTDKGFRFVYWPAGKKPRSYINGLAELKAAYRAYNTTEENELHNANPEAVYREKKLPEAVICSGERDSLCCRSMGYNPLWFNSETYQLSIEEYNEIKRYAEVIYNIPDTDETGRRKGAELALRFIDIHTVKLPDWLGGYVDNRKKPRKDLRDWMELRQTRDDFRNLLNGAYPVRFWTTTINDKGKQRHDIDSACLLYFLSLNGFHTLHDDDIETTQFIRIVGNIVRRVTTKNIREFVIQWVRDRYEDRDILNLVLNSMKLSPAALESLPEVNLDFSSYTQSSQLFFFPDQTVEVLKSTALNDDGFRSYRPGQDSLHNYVWEENVINHKFKRLEPMFKVTRSDEAKPDAFDIEILNTDSHFFGYLINSSRIHWRKEMEERFMGDKAAMREYAEVNRFRIDGEGLTEREKAEQKQNLLSKIFTFGYMLHRYKSVSHAWAPMAMDSKIGELGECNGRSGKSFYFSTLALMMKTVKLSGRNPKLMDNPHVFDQVNRATQMMLIDDCDRNLNMGLFYDNITSDLTVNPKNNHSFTIPFHKSPKIAFTTNYIPSEFSPSTEARSLYLVFSDYYHQKTDSNDYLETRSIRDDFHKDLYSESYTDDEWNADINFFLQCCHFYLQHASEGIKLQPPMENIMIRKLKADMGENFEEWAEGYFSPESGNLDEFIQRDKALGDYMFYSKVNRVTMQGFTKKLKAFVALCPWIEELNPPEFCSTTGRIQRKVEVSPGVRQTKDVIYLRSSKTYTPPAPQEQSLFDDEDSDKPF